MRRAVILISGLALAALLQGCLATAVAGAAVGVAGAAVGATGAVVGATAKGVGAVGRAGRILLMAAHRRLDLERVTVHAAIAAVGGADGDEVGGVEGGRLGDLEYRGRHGLFLEAAWEHRVLRAGRDICASGRLNANA